MPFIPVANTAQVEFRMVWQGQRVENVDYFKFGAPPDPSELVTLGGALQDWWEANYAPFASFTLELREIYITDLTASDAAAVTVAPAVPIPGLNANESLPNNVSAVISFRTSQRGRSFRGRNYICGLTDDQVVNNNVISSAADAIVAAYVALGAVAIANSVDHVVVSRQANNAPRVTGVATPITAYLMTDTTVDSQRRRLPGRGT